jgi:hypothetical protein
MENLMKVMFGAATNMVVKSTSSLSKGLDAVDELSAAIVVYAKDFRLDAESDARCNGDKRLIREAESKAESLKRMKELGITMPEAS